MLRPLAYNMLFFFPPDSGGPISEDLKGISDELMELQKEVNDTQKVIQDSTDKYENIDLDNLNEQIGNVSGTYSAHERCQVSNMIARLWYNSAGTPKQMDLKSLDKELDNESFKLHAIWSVITILCELIFLWGVGGRMVVSVHSYKIPLILTKQCSVGPPLILSLLVCVIKFWNGQLLGFS